MSDEKEKPQTPDAPDDQVTRDLLGQDTKEFFEDSPQVQVIETLSPSAVLKALEGKINAEGWDIGPKLIFLRGNDLGIESVEIDLPDDVKADFMSNFGGWVFQIMMAVNELKAGDETPNANEIHEFYENLLGPGFQGFLFSSEGWMVKEPSREEAPEEWARWVAARDSGSFHEHPDRVEVRNTTIVTPYSDMFTLTRVRDQEPTYSQIPGEGWQFRKFGLLPEFLRMFMQVCVLIQGLHGTYDNDILKYWRGEQEKMESVFKGADLPPYRGTVMSTDPTPMPADLPIPDDLSGLTGD